MPHESVNNNNLDLRVACPDLGCHIVARVRTGIEAIVGARKSDEAITTVDIPVVLGGRRAEGRADSCAVSSVTGNCQALSVR